MGEQGWRSGLSTRLSSPWRGSELQHSNQPKKTETLPFLSKFGVQDVDRFSQVPSDFGTINDEKMCIDARRLKHAHKTMCARRIKVKGSLPLEPSLPIQSHIINYLLNLERSNGFLREISNHGLAAVNTARPLLLL